MDLSIIDKINENSSRYPEMAQAKKILSENGVDFEKRTVDIDKLVAYQKSTSPNGIIMPTKDILVAKVCAALMLLPQKEQNGQINYLFGKGIGIEIALLGNCPGRQTSDASFEVRSHSDFEIYDVKDDKIFDQYPEFQQVFGAQEYFPESQTKGLVDIPSGYLDRTHQIVDFYGIEVLVPSLEVLYVDKCLRTESTPRPEGYDAHLLAKKYKLNPEICKKLFKECYAPRQIERLKHVVPDFEVLVQKINNFVKSSLENEPEQIKSFNNFTKLCPNASGYGGIPFGAVVPLEGGDIANKQVTPAYIAKLEEKYEVYAKQKMATLEQDYADVMGPVEQINENTSSWSDWLNYKKHRQSSVFFY